MQQYYIRALFKGNESKDINLVKSIFKKKLNIPLLLTNQEITKQKSLVIGGHKNDDLLSICKKISNEDINVNIHSMDIFYDYKNKSNKIQKREETVIFLTMNEMEKQ